MPGKISLCSTKDLESSLQHCGGSVKLVEASLCTRKDVETSLHRCGCPVMLVHLSVPVKLKKADFTTVISYEGRAGSFECWASGQSCFSPVGRPVKLVEASLCTRKDLESSLHRCGYPVKLLHAYLSVRNDLDNSFHHCGGHVKHVQASLSARKDREISFDRCGGPMYVVHVWLTTVQVP